MTAPLVAADVDLRDFPFMPLEIAQVKQSRAWLICKRRPELAFYMINLWTAAWHARPCASLEDDDLVLADAAMCGEETWRAVRADVMRGWIKCDDGRLYHPVVAEKALEGWLDKLAQRRSGAAGNAKRSGSAFDSASFDSAIEDAVERLSALNPAARFFGKRPARRAGAAPAPVVEAPAAEIADPGATLSRPCRDPVAREGKGSEGRKNSEADASGGAPPDPDADLFARGRHILGKNAGGQVVRLKRLFGGDVARTREFLEAAAGKHDPAQYVAAAITRHAGDFRARAGPNGFASPQTNLFIQAAIESQKDADRQRSYAS